MVVKATITNLYLMAVKDAITNLQATRRRSGMRAPLVQSMIKFGLIAAVQRAIRKYIFNLIIIKLF